MIQFPLQTAPKWADEDIANGGVDSTGGKIGRQEFQQYFKDIFTGDVQRYLPGATLDDIMEADPEKEDYYRQLHKQVDANTGMFELYRQFPAQDGASDSYFAFVFGMVNGQFKLLACYAKWPVKSN